MARFKSYSYDQTKLIPVDLRTQLQPGSFEFAIHQLIDEMDLGAFQARFQNDDTGAPAYDPAVLLKVVLLGYSRGLVSSRELERACRENVVFMAISADTKPHFTTIARFISTMQGEITPLFRNVLLVCSQEGLIGREMFAIDGCKLSSNCSKEWSGKRADFEKRVGKIEHSIEVLLRKHGEVDATDLPAEVRAKEEAAIDRLRKRRQKLEGWLETGKDKRGARGLKQSNLTDDESAKMPSAHGVVQGYNGIAAVDAKRQVVVHAEAHGEGQETGLLAPMVDGIRAAFRDLGETRDPFAEAKLVADNGYHSEANLRRLDDEGIDAYLPDNQFRRRDPAFADAARYRRSVDRKKLRYPSKPRYFQVRDFRWNATRGKLVCPAGKELYLKNRHFQEHRGLRGVSYMAKRTDCRACSLRSRCLRNPHTVARQVTLFQGRDPTFEPNYTQRMRERFDSPLGRYYYSRRLGIIEPVFAHVRHARGLDRFTLRGRTKVDIQWKLYCMVHNIGKLLRYSPRFA